jgi:hypothetical protein
MGYSTNSGPFWVGTLVFVILGVVACLASSALAKAGRNQYLGSVSFFSLSLCARPPVPSRCAAVCPPLGHQGCATCDRICTAISNGRSAQGLLSLHRGLFGAALLRARSEKDCSLIVRVALAPLVAHPFLCSLTYVMITMSAICMWMLSVSHLAACSPRAYVHAWESRSACR